MWEEGCPWNATNVAARALHAVSPRQIEHAGQDIYPEGRVGPLGRTMWTLEAREWHESLRNWEEGGRALASLLCNGANIRISKPRPYRDIRFYWFYAKSRYYTLKLCRRGMGICLEPRLQHVACFCNATSLRLIFRLIRVCRVSARRRHTVMSNK